MKKNILFIWFCLCWLVVNKAVAGDDNFKRFVVIKVFDGDTLKGVVDYKYQTIRLAGIDCPENRINSKMFEQLSVFELENKEELLKRGKYARNKLKKLLEFYEEEIYFVEKKNMVCKYGNGKRLVGDMYAGGMNVSEYMIKEGGCVKMGCKEK
ncbi:MAG: thermonuclease family protein [Alphaproteobacteria bacterium]|nr:thermonuclease family protein [Alphaproteobacteria bacterium]